MILRLLWTPWILKQTKVGEEQVASTQAASALVKLQSLKIGKAPKVWFVLGFLFTTIKVPWPKQREALLLLRTSMAKSGVSAIPKGSFK